MDKNWNIIILGQFIHICLSIYTPYNAILQHHHQHKSKTSINQLPSYTNRVDPFLSWMNPWCHQPPRKMPEAVKKSKCSALHYFIYLIIYLFVCITINSINFTHQFNAPSNQKGSVNFIRWQFRGRDQLP